MKDAEATKTLFLEVAKKLFAQNGFYGVSIAAISAELGMTKQALLHHFGSKERLYGTVLEGISERFLETLEAGPESLQDAVRRLFEHMSQERDDARIVMRELLDNTERAERSRKWYLRPFLDHLLKLGRKNPNWSEESDAEIFGRIYQLVGAVNYWVISGPTLGRMYGPETMQDITDAFPGTLLKDL